MSIRSKNLLGSKLLGDDVLGRQTDPMASMGNLMDVMLVFACGLMIALIAHYNVELQPSDPDSSLMEQFEGELESAEEGASTESSNYAEVGTVYRDLETGELYVLSPEGTAE